MTHSWLVFLQTYEVKIHVVSLQVPQCAVQRNRDVLRRMVGVPAQMFQDLTLYAIQ